jgi:hypothetical protein
MEKANLRATEALLGPRRDVRSSSVQGLSCCLRIGQVRRIINGPDRKDAPGYRTENEPRLAGLKKNGSRLRGLDLFFQFEHDYLRALGLPPGRPTALDSPQAHGVYLTSVASMPEPAIAHHAQDPSL